MMAELKRYWTSIGELLLRMENNENERRKKYLNNLMIFEGHEVEVFELDGQVLFNPYHVGKCLELGDSAVRKAIGNMTEKQVTKLRNSDVKESIFFLKVEYIILFFEVISQMRRHLRIG